MRTPARANNTGHLEPQGAPTPSTSRGPTPQSIHGTPTAQEHRPWNLRGAGLAAALVALLAPTPAASEDRIHVWARGAAEAWDMRGTDHDTVRRRRFTQLLGLYGWYHPRPPDDDSPRLVGVDTSLRLTTDFGPDDPQLARLDPGGDTLADLHLMTLYAEVNRLGGVLDLRLGRQNLLNPVGWFDFDGLTTRLHSPSGWNLTLYGGLPVNEGGQTIDSSLLGDAGTVGREVDGFADRTLVTGMGLGYTSAPLRVQLALHRVAFLDRTLPPSPDPIARMQGQQVTDALDPALWPTGQDVRQELLGVALYGAPFDALTLTGEALYNLPVRDLDRVLLDSTVVVVADRARVGAALESDRPRFDLDSVWNVFGARPSGGYRLHTDGALADGALWGGDLTWSGAFTWRTYGGPDGQGLILPGLVHDADAEEVLGGRLGARWRQERPNRRWFPSLDLQVNARGERGQGGALLTADARGRVGVVYDAWIDLLLLTLYTDRTWQPLRSGQSGAAALGAGWTFERWGEVLLRGEVSSTSSYLVNTRLLALYSLSLEVFDR